MDYFDKNLKVLKAHDPALAQRVAAIPFPESLVVETSKDGYPVPKINGVYLHSAYKPLEEARKSVHIGELAEDQRVVVLGLGFGYHVHELLMQTDGSITVIEPSLQLFRALLSCRDFSDLLTSIQFYIETPPAKLFATEDPTQWNVFEHKPSLRIAPEYYKNLDQCAQALQVLGSNSLRILVVNPIYGGSLPTANYCADALRTMGHHVESVHCEDFVDSFHGIHKVTSNKGNRQILDRMFISLMGQVILAKAADCVPDLVLVLAQAPMSPETIQSLKKLDAPIAFWFVEDFRTLSYWKEIAPLYDHFFTIQRGEFFEELAESGAHNYYYLPQACHPQTHRPLDLSDEDRERYECDLSFMGAGYFNRQQSFPHLLDQDFKIWGTEWNLQTEVGERVQNKNERVSGEDTVKIYNAGKINLNLHSSICHSGVNPEGDFVNPRTFEIPACGGFQLVDERSELAELFRVDEEIAVFSSIEELKEKINYYLKHPDERLEIIAKGRARVLAEHTMAHRMREMLIHVFANQAQALKQRIQSRRDPVEQVIEEAGEGSSLAGFMENFRGVADFSLDTVMTQIENGQGKLSREETLFLMLDQVVKKED
ncbi:MAG: glycosyltransferase [Candidatus Nitrohelix vancouverensis]|uniref:Glycosyltransferase n=1 Tax=Candidatus Nitrohelix vancouverensis TaxID=2705534 RepID=A0A7T0C3S7_9BACT|nr:MAG: glycosyltransferase [Candidatus Nitrohelix vancouverensis]